MFYAYRLKILSKSWVPTVPVVLVSVTRSCPALPSLKERKFALCAIVSAIVTGTESLAAGKLSKLFVSKNYIATGVSYCSFVLYFHSITFYISCGTEVMQPVTFSSPRIWPIMYDSRVFFSCSNTCAHFLQLSRQIARTSPTQMRSRISRLIRLIVEAGILTG